jgi:ubiquinone/menaquinone biosynthesis C-methylase UbiE
MIRPNRDEQALFGGVDNAKSGNVNKAYHDYYDGESSYEDSFEEYFDAQYTADLIEIIWGNKPPYKLLDCGSANGLTLAEFADIGIEAWGIENSEHIHSRTAPEWRSRNLFGDVCAMPFGDDEFDFLYDTSLCHVPPKDIDRAIREMARVCKKGIFFGAITSDMTQEVIDAYDLFYGVNTLLTLREWSERFLQNGFRLATTDPDVLDRAFKCETAANEGDYPWYSSAASMRYCFYTKEPRRSGK